MKKRTEILVVSLVLCCAAGAAAMTSNDGSERPETAAVAEPTVVQEAPAAPVEEAETDTTAPEPERRGNPVVYDMDIPAEVLRDY